MSGKLTMEDVSTLERHIDLLFEYKPIPEHEVKALCEKVRIGLLNDRQKRFFKQRVTFSRLNVP